MRPRVRKLLIGLFVVITIATCANATPQLPTNPGDLVDQESLDQEVWQIFREWHSISYNLFFGLFPEPPLRIPILTARDAVEIQGSDIDLKVLRLVPGLWFKPYYESQLLHNAYPAFIAVGSDLKSLKKWLADSIEDIAVTYEIKSVTEIAVILDMGSIETEGARKVAEKIRSDCLEFGITVVDSLEKMKGLSPEKKFLIFVVHGPESFYPKLEEAARQGILSGKLVINYVCGEEAYDLEMAYAFLKKLAAYRQTLKERGVLCSIFFTQPIEIPNVKLAIQKFVQSLEKEPGKPLLSHFFVANREVPELWKSMLVGEFLALLWRVRTKERKRRCGRKAKD